MLIWPRNMKHLLRTVPTKYIGLSPDLTEDHEENVDLT